MVLAVFAGMLIFSSPNYASTFALNPLNPGAGIVPQVVSQILKAKTDLQNPPLLFKKKKAVEDPYAHAWKVARLLAASA